MILREPPVCTRQAVRARFEAMQASYSNRKARPATQAWLKKVVLPLQLYKNSFKDRSPEPLPFVRFTILNSPWLIHLVHEPTLAILILTMGCCGSSEVDDTQQARPQAQAPQGIPLSNLSPGNADADILADDTRREFLNVLKASFGDTPYLVIGGSALAEHGSDRATKDVDVIIGGGLSKRSALDLLEQGSGGQLVKRGHGTMV